MTIRMSKRRLPYFHRLETRGSGAANSSARRRPLVQTGVCSAQGYSGSVRAPLDHLPTLPSDAATQSWRSLGCSCIMLRH